MTTPDTTEAVAEAIANALTYVHKPNRLHHEAAMKAIAAHNKALEEAGYVTINRAELAATMEDITEAEVQRRLRNTAEQDLGPEDDVVNEIHTAEQDGEVEG